MSIRLVSFKLCFLVFAISYVHLGFMWVMCHHDGILYLCVWHCAPFVPQLMWKTTCGKRSSCAFLFITCSPYHHITIIIQVAQSSLLLVVHKLRHYMLMKVMCSSVLLFSLSTWHWLVHVTCALQWCLVCLSLLVCVCHVLLCWSLVLTRPACYLIIVHLPHLLSLLIVFWLCSVLCQFTVDVFLCLWCSPVLSPSMLDCVFNCPTG